MSQRYQAAILSASFNGLKAPDAPTIGTATAGAGSASVAFTAPANVGGGAITGYTVISSPGSIIGTGASSPVTVSGLTNGTAYTFTVVATNAYGTGPASAASNSVTPAVNYIEDVFSTYLYTGTGANQSIVNGVDLSGKGGLVWIKDRAASNHLLMTTDGGPTNRLRSNGQPSYVTSTAGRDLSSFNSNGFSLGIDEQSSINTLASKYASWSFRKQPKFFDVVTWTGNGTNRTIPHNLGSVPGCIIIGTTSAIGADWSVYHSGLANTEYLTLNSTVAKGTDATYWNSTTATSSVFSLGTSFQVNYNTGTYIAYVFASNAGGFGLTGTDNVISCGSFTTDGSANATVNLGYEPQWVMIKSSSNTGNWFVIDNMRNFSRTVTASLSPNLSNAESAGFGDATYSFFPTATGFQSVQDLAASQTYIYIAIRRGPMKVPTSGTSVFNATANAGTGSTKFITTNFPVDLTIQSNRNDVISHFTDRLRGGGANASPRIYSQFTDAETNASAGRGINFDSNTGVTNLLTYNNGVGDNFIYYAMARAPSFFDEVCYTGTGSATTVTHNLAAVPELIICKQRNSANSWYVYASPLGASKGIALNGAFAAFTTTGMFSLWNDTDPTSSVFSLGQNSSVNASAATYVAYLFATCAGVSKVGSYTGTGALQTINCAFTTGARFVLIKRTDSTGDWYVWDSARGITSGNDPYLLLNSTAAEVTGTNYVDSTAAGFQVTAAAPAGLNAAGGTYIFLAIA